ncbi:hypothetical protein [Nitrosomonas sp. Nm33]|uniref:hypothetical protein n=1 Tax=Nitrosomonas sp. Nm33 TaxID=133724 RepID=UPI000895812F|nr:hypothetical protein [Nitrosomonas sp. Nm33]SDY36975.1 hypothetical protein SAMN05421755_101834 [Nitrosomonas sp. Nm33]
MKLFSYFIFLISLFIGNAIASSENDYKQIGKLEDISLASTKRVLIRIAVPDGLSRAELTTMLTNIAIQVDNQQSAAATNVFAYRLEDIKVAGKTSYTAGMATYAPNGRWEDSMENSPKKVTIKLADIYFQQKNKVKNTGEDVTLVSKNGGDIYVSSSKSNWGDEYIIGKIANGTKAKVLEIYEFPVSSSHIFVRYKISLTYKRKNIEGWISDHNIKM